MLRSRTTPSFMSQTLHTALHDARNTHAKGSGRELQQPGSSSSLSERLAMAEHIGEVEGVRHADYCQPLSLRLVRPASAGDGVTDTYMHPPTRRSVGDGWMNELERPVKQMTSPTVCKCGTTPMCARDTKRTVDAHRVLSRRKHALCTTLAERLCSAVRLTCLSFS